MASNNEILGKALEHLRDGLNPYVDRETSLALSAFRLERSDLREYMVKERLLKKPVPEWDAQALLKFMTHAAHWHKIFARTLGREHRRYASELRDWRNAWAHQKRIATKDALRALDSAGRLLTAVSAAGPAQAVQTLKRELEQRAFDRRTQKAYARFRAAPAAGLAPWREVAQPHSDVSSGLYRQAEFAADLHQVHLGQGSDTYADPAQFFRRTFLTRSLKELLINAIQRITAGRGEPVIALQTNFGGGKTHSMLALYHLFSGAALHTMEGMPGLMAQANASKLPAANRVVLVGNKLAPGSAAVKDDGTEVNTIWGELAWQLGGRKAYDVIAQDDRSATNPGEKLEHLLRTYHPALILIDEWVAYARQLPDHSDALRLPAGTFETQFTFAQTLTEAVKAVPDCFLVLSLPASTDIRDPVHAHAEDEEVGGERGKIALRRLRHVCARLARPWSPAAAQEGFEIVRRRLFEPLEGEEKAAARNAVAAKYRALYNSHPGRFPAEVADRDYEERMRKAYPIHPEVFDRLYSDWSTLPRFQRTRGVLRLMAAVIHRLWEANDQSPLIMPADIALDFDNVRSEISRYLPEHWDPIIQTDIDGASSLPARLDGEKVLFGKHAVCRRVARTMFLGSAPMAHASKGGITRQRTLLGSVVPGHAPAHYHDAIGNLAHQATYLYHVDNRYRFDTRPTVTKLAADIAEDLRQQPLVVQGELRKRLERACRDKGDFAAVHVCPDGPEDVSDERAARLVVLGAEHHYSGRADSPARKQAARIVESIGKKHRTYRNALVFLAADVDRREDLNKRVRNYLAWSSIVDNHERHNLTAQQKNQAVQRVRAASGEVDRWMLDTFRWVLFPDRDDSKLPVRWEAAAVSGHGALAARVSKWLKLEEAMVGVLGPVRLKMALDAVPLWRRDHCDHVAVRQLLDDFFTYFYLPRLQNEEVLIRSIREGVKLPSWRTDSFAFAERYDEKRKRYEGLRAGTSVSLDRFSPGVVVRSEAACRQQEAEDETDRSARESDTAPGSHGSIRSQPPKEPFKPGWFSGSVNLDPNMAGMEAATIANEVIRHLSALSGAKVQVTMELEVTVADGIDNHTERTVRENARTLKFTTVNFETKDR